MERSPFLRGPRVALYPVERDDLDLLARARAEPALREPLGFDTPWPDDRIESFYENEVAGNDDSAYFVIDRHDATSSADDVSDEVGDATSSESDATSSESDAGDEASDGAAGSETGEASDGLGTIALFDVDEVDGQVGYWLRRDAQGAGYATEAVALVGRYAFAERRLHRLTATVFESNEASIRLLERLGFVHEGTDREARWTGGEFVDEERYGLLADEAAFDEWL